MGRLIAFCSPAVIGALAAKALVVAPAVGAAATAEGALEDDAVAFFDFMDLCRISSELLDAGEDLMAENNRIRHFQLAVQIFYVGAADTAHFYFYMPLVRWNVGNRIFGDL